jgi:hypothetical protein
MAINTFAVVLTGNCGNQFVQNVLHYRMDDATFSTSIAAADGLLKGWHAAGMLDEWLAMHCQAYEYLSAKCRKVSGGIGPEDIDLTGAGAAGVRTGQTQASSAGPVILWIPVGPNRVKGKTFIAGISIADINFGEISSSCIADLIDAATNMNQSFPAVGAGTPSVQLCIAKSTDKSTTWLIGAIEVCKEVGLQRRRQRPV